MSQLLEQHCTPVAKGSAALDADSCASLLEQISEWQLTADNTAISRDFRFKNFHHTMAFVNALAWVAHQEDHHPDMEVGYNHCMVVFSTHSIGGLSINDFICAAKINQLVAQS